MPPFKREIEGEYREPNSLDLDMVRPFPGTENLDPSEAEMVDLREEVRNLHFDQELEPLVLVRAIEPRGVIANAMPIVGLSYYLLDGHRQLWLHRNSPVRLRLPAIVFRVPKNELKNVRYLDGKVFIVSEQAE